MGQATTRNHRGDNVFVSSSKRDAWGDCHGDNSSKRDDPGPCEDMSAADLCSERHPACRLCCKPADTQAEEVVIVHHDALMKMDFLLRHDDFRTCNQPAVPECVSAVHRAKIQKLLESGEREGLCPKMHLAQPTLPDTAR